MPLPCHCPAIRNLYNRITNLNGTLEGKSLGGIGQLTGGNRAGARESERGGGGGGGAAGPGAGEEREERAKRKEAAAESAS